MANQALLSPEAIIKEISKNKPVSMSQIRKILASVNTIYNEVLIARAEGEIINHQLPKEIVNDIAYLKIKLVYQCGRHDAVKKFDEVAKLQQRIDAIGKDETKFMEFHRFMEAVVAYHKFNIKEKK